MSWFAELAGKAEDLLNNFDEQAGVALRNHNVVKPKRNDQIDLHPELWNSTQKKRPPRTWKKSSGQKSPGSLSPSRKPSDYRSSAIREPKEGPKQPLSKTKKKKHEGNNNEFKTLVSDVKESNSVIGHPFPQKEKRFSMPSTMEIAISKADRKDNMENLGLENIMLKNELTFLNREMTDVVNRLRLTEEGEDVIVDIEKELMKTRDDVEFYEQSKSEMNSEKLFLMNKIDDLKKELHNHKVTEQKRLNENMQKLQLDVNNLTTINKELEESVKTLQGKLSEKESVVSKLETELRHAQMKISELQSDLDKSNSECKRLEKDWDTYKHRVKSMLISKDKEIKALSEGKGLNEDTMVLLDQIEELKKEREDLSETLAQFRADAEDMKTYITSMETRHTAAERVVAALRDALKDERFARNRAEAQFGAAAKELKSIQIETGQTIANLRSALRDKELELNRFRESTSSSTPRSEPSALNVADYDNNKESETVQFLSQKLVQRQNKIDALLADNNTLKVQLAKVQSTHKMEQLKQKSDSVVDFNEERRSKTANLNASSGMSKLSVRMGLLLRRNPFFRILVLVYMMGLHVWVMTVLFASTPDNIAIKPSRK